MRLYSTRSSPTDTCRRRDILKVEITLIQVHAVLNHVPRKEQVLPTVIIEVSHGHSTPIVDIFKIQNIVLSIIIDYV